MLERELGLGVDLDAARNAAVEVRRADRLAMESRSVTRCPQKIASSSSGKKVSPWPSFFGRCLRRSLPSPVACSSTACSSGVSSRSLYVFVCRCFMAVIP